VTGFVNHLLAQGHDQALGSDVDGGDHVLVDAVFGLGDLLAEEVEHLIGADEADCFDVALARKLVWDLIAGHWEPRPEVCGSPGFIGRAALEGAIAVMAVVEGLEDPGPFGEVGQVIEALGSKFDLRKFNDTVVKAGGVPMVTLARGIDSFIARERSG
jgi:hypothetical protein